MNVRGVCEECVCEVDVNNGEEEVQQHTSRQSW